MATSGRERDGHLVKRVLTDPRFSDFILDVEQEVGDRPARASSCTVVEIPSDLTEEQHGSLARIPEGTVTAFVAARDEPVLNDLVQATSERDGEQFSSALRRLAKSDDHVANKIVHSIARARTDRSTLDPGDLPTLAEIRYEAKSLARHIFVNADMPIRLQLFPYTGGQLIPSSFSLVEHYRSDRDVQLQCVLLIRPPQLTETERQALRLVPAGSSTINIGADGLAVMPAAVTAWIAEAAGAAVVGWVVSKVLDWAFGFQAELADRTFQRDSLDERLRSLPPEATARELLEARRQLLLGD